MNECKIEIERLQSLTENLTKEHLLLEEELRNVRLEYDDLRMVRNEVDEKNTTIAELKNQLQMSSKQTLELQGLINDLQKEREKLRQEIEKFQKQALEVFTHILIPALLSFRYIINCSVHLNKLIHPLLFEVTVLVINIPFMTLPLVNFKIKMAGFGHFLSLFTPWELF